MNYNWIILALFGWRRCLLSVQFLVMAGWVIFLKIHNTLPEEADESFPGHHHHYQCSPLTTTTTTNQIEKKKKKHISSQMKEKFKFNLAQKTGGRKRTNQQILDMMSLSVTEC